MPKLISIAVESPRRPRRYIAIDSEGNVWRGQIATKRGRLSAIKWEPIKSEFPVSSERVRFVGGHEQQEEDELEQGGEAG